MGLLYQYADYSKIDGCSTNVEGVCFVYDKDKKMGEFTTAVTN